MLYCHQNWFFWWFISFMLRIQDQFSSVLCIIRDLQLLCYSFFLEAYLSWLMLWESCCVEAAMSHLIAIKHSRRIWNYEWLNSPCSACNAVIPCWAWVETLFFLLPKLEKKKKPFLWEILNHLHVIFFVEPLQSEMRNCVNFHLDFMILKIHLGCIII